MNDKSEKELFEAVFKQRGIKSFEQTQDDLFSLFVLDAFKNGSILEPIYGQNQIIGYESLCRPDYKEGKEISMDKVATGFYERGAAIEFDILTCEIGLETTQYKLKKTFEAYGLDYAAKKIPHQKHKKLPVTLNISVESALSPTFWKKLEPYLENFNAQDVIFEILEHDVDPTADISHLNTLKRRGYRFALDDFAAGPEHQNRLKIFADIIDFIKIDGPLIRNAIEEQDRSLNDITKSLKDHKLVAERVHSKTEANQLFDMGFYGVQGRELKHEDFTYIQ